MTERPILFNGAMVRALLDGTKTQTRRVIKKAPGGDGWKPMRELVDGGIKWQAGATWEPDIPLLCPYGVPGDQLWVRETWALEYTAASLKRCRMRACPPTQMTPSDLDDWGLRCLYDADESTEGPWRPSIHMNRWASRITLEVTDVRVERVQDISESDAEAEGVFFDRLVEDGSGAQGTDDSAGPLVRQRVGPPGADLQPSAEEAFADLWDSINAKRGYGWEVNPWVWVVGFKRIEQGDRP